MTLNRIVRIITTFLFLTGIEFVILFIVSLTNSTNFVANSSRCIFDSSIGCNFIEIYLIPFILIILNIAIGFVLSKSQVFTDKTKWKVDVRNRIAQIQSSYSSNDQSKLKFAVLEADKILSYALKMYGIKGKTTFERIKASKKIYDKKLYQQINHAHWIRNKIAHEVGFEMSNDELKKEFWALRNGIMRLIK